MLRTSQLSFQVIYLLLHDLMTVSPLGYVTTYLGMTLARLGSMYASLTIPPAAWVGRIILPLGPNGFCLLWVSLVRILLVWT